MALTAEEQQLRARFFKVLLEATLPLQPRPECSNWSIGMPEPACCSRQGQATKRPWRR